MRTLHPAASMCVLALAACSPSAAKVPLQGPTAQAADDMTLCPSAVTGASTSLKQLGDGVALDITADDPKAAEDIMARAQLHAAMAAPATAELAHPGNHAGLAERGQCPIIHDGTTVTVEQILGGARITVTAKDPAEAHALQRDTRERLAGLDTGVAPATTR